MDKVSAESYVTLTTYRLFWMNRAGRIVGIPDTVDAQDDAGAVQEAEKMAHGRSAEVWDRSRRVATLNVAEQA